MTLAHAMQRLVIGVLGALLLAGGAWAADVPVHGSEQAGFSRLVFDWPISVGYRVEREGDAVTIHFDDAATFDFKELPDTGLRYIEPPSAAIVDGRSVVRLRLAAGIRLRHFRQDSRVAIDAMLEKPLEEKAALEDLDDTISRARDATLKLNEADRKAAIERAMPHLALAPVWRANIATAPAVLSIAVDDSRTKLERLPVALHHDDTATRLRFAWDVEVAAAVWKRGDMLWVVFDQQLVPDHAALRGQFDDRVRAAASIPLPGATALRYRIRDDQNIGVRREGNAWLVELKSTLILPRSSLRFHRGKGGEHGSVLAASLGEPGVRLFLRDPVVGDQVAVAPLRAASVGLGEPQQQAQFSLLASAQGLVVEIGSDAVYVDRRKQDVEIGTGPVAVAAATGPAVEQPAEEIKPSLLVDLAAWRGDLSRSYTERQQALLERLSNAPAEQMGGERWALARFYVANGMGADALAVMTQMRADDPMIVERPEFHAARGIALFRARRYDEAAAELAAPELADRPEAALWRAAVAEAQGDPQRALDEYQLGADVLALFGDEERAAFEMAAARAAMATGDLKRVEEEIAAIGGLRLSPELTAAKRYLEAELDEKKGDTDQALLAYEALAADGVRAVAAQAMVRAMEIKLAKGNITNEQAIDTLENLRFAWRGGAFEFTLLDRLGALYVAAHRYREGLETWREAATYFKTSRDVAMVTDQMEMLFLDLFLKGGADQMQPVSALALYYDFRELTPLGTDGDAMIRRLADRLVEVDLLDRAAGLLEHQVKYRLEGVAQASVATRLAMIYLLDSQPEKAVGALRATRQAVIPLDLATQRKRLEARALIDLGSYSEAEVLLDGDEEREALLLRSEIFWGAKRWGDLIANARQLLGDRWRGDRPLDLDERRQIMRYAIALTLADHKGDLKALRRDFGSLMARGAMSEAFDVITKDVDHGETDLRALSKDIAGIDRLEAFMANYRAAFTPGATGGS